MQVVLRWQGGIEELLGRHGCVVQALRAGLCGHRALRAPESRDMPAPAEPSGSHRARVEGGEAALSHHPP